LDITIPEGNNDSGDNIDVDKNNDAKYDIAMPITDDDDFLSFVDEVNGGERALSGDLQADIEIQSTVAYTPIARDWKNGGMYRGTFNGHDHEITLTLMASGSFLGLFGTNDGTIKNLKVNGSLTLDENDTDADFIGMVGFNGVNGRIIGCVNKATITAYTAGKPDNAHSVAGIAGFSGCDLFSPDSPYYDPDPDPEPAYLPGGYIFQCRNEGNVTGGFNKIGGIAGESAGTVEQCVNLGDITDIKGSTDRGWPGAGLVGRNGNNNTAIESAVIKDSYNRGKIIANAKQGTSENAYGGITGWSDKLSKVQNCYTTGQFEEASGSLRGTKNPIIGMSDEEPAEMGTNNFSLNTIFASSPDDIVLSGTRKLEADMKTEAFVNLLNAGRSDGPYVTAVDDEGQPDYPKLKWEVE
jgi:hypothetical protein